MNLRIFWYCVLLFTMRSVFSAPCTPPTKNAVPDLPSPVDVSDSKKILKPLSKNNEGIPFNFKRYNNAVWKFAGLFFIAGLFIAGFCLVAFFKVSHGPFDIWIYGFLIGLALIAGSLPLMLIGAMIG